MRIINLMKPIFIFFLLGLGLLSAFRIGLLIWQQSNISHWSDYVYILSQGVRIDIATLCWLYTLPAFLLALLPTSGKFGRGFVFVLRSWLVCGLVVLAYMELATPSFILEYNLRPNRLFIEYLVYPKEVFSMLWKGYKLPLFLGLAGATLVGFYSWRLSGKLTQTGNQPRWWTRPILAVCVVAFGIMGARSTLQHRPLNPALVAFSTNPLLNDLVLNSSYSLVFAAKSMASERNAEEYYGDMPLEEIISTIKAYSPSSTHYLVNSAYPTLNTKQAIGKDKKNLVILLQESLGAQFVGALGGLPLTPNLDNLMKQGWNFTQAYATGTRSVRGIEAVTTGFTPTPSRAVVKLSKSQTGFFTIADVLKQQGYTTQFIYGGESHFDNMKSFFLGNGFQDIVDFSQFEHPQFVGSWGVSDQDLYNMADKQFRSLHQKGEPFFSLVFTSSNHSPYEYPDGQITPYTKGKNTRLNTVKYSDHALGDFFKKAKQSDYWQNTVFLIIADHDSRAYGDDPVPVSRFHIPALIIGKDIPKHKDTRLVSSLDMPPTLLSLIGIDATTPMIGHDLNRAVPSDYQRAMMQFDKNFGYLTRESLVVLQPKKDPVAYQYNFVKQALSPIKLNQEAIVRAKAHALMGGKLYRQGLYPSGINNPR
ncbi:hypothetical protein BZG73_07350 [Salinivibrio siamensis]|uniref:Sulfatase N-terminal domain-containing protein n=2 Tax=Vibrionaceae TaxID=641 RepID=A0ABX3K9X4_9GAMM|nr:hypothetical protein BZG73_07350 [Salinivibrio siamensis]